MKNSWSALLILAAVLFSPGSVSAESLRLCAAENDAPRASRTAGAGFDLDILGAVAKKLGRQLEIVWIAQPPVMTEVESTDLPLEPLLAGACDMLASVPGALALTGTGGKLALSVPYYGAGFELVGDVEKPAHFGDLRGHHIAVQTVSVAHLALQRTGIDWVGRDSPAELLAAVDAGEADAALVWGPALGPLGRAPKTGTAPPEILRWNQHVAVRKQDAALLAAINTALREMLAGGEIAAAMGVHHIPPHAPFDTVFTQASLLHLRLD